jgi:hypothetical protein
MVNMIFLGETREVRYKDLKRNMAEKIYFEFNENLRKVISH